ncbi:hypothetical protein OESDEN_00191 [Oesophagostomum dentatum]|uniref:Uncharacterized protein n=1 Tax=Oesophagostomum dentatum TaxID=61180 RepID=A0A0B1TWF6_OESDE|nr:hypothetical protein OESDEN_00191 [Oesophagostomum dentatum]
MKKKKAITTLADKTSIHGNLSKVNIPSSPRAMEKNEAAFKSVKLGKQSGEDITTAQKLTWGKPKLIPLITELFNDILHTCSVT